MTRRAQLLLSLVAFTACEPEPKAERTVFNVSVRGSLHVVPATSMEGGSLAELQSLCGAKPNLQIQFFEAVAFLLSPGTAKPMATCPVADDGSFACPDVDFARVSAAVSVVVDDVDDTVSDCAAPTTQIAIYCSFKALQDKADAACGSGKVIEDHVLADGEAGFQPLVVAPRAWLAELDTLPVPPGLHKPSQAGVVLNRVTGDNGVPQANALPYLPIGCRDGSFACRSILLAANDAGLQISDTATQTDTTGWWVAQVESHTATGDLQPIPLDTNAGANQPSGYGAIDCGSENPKSCFTIVPTFPHVAGVLKDARGNPTIADVSINGIGKEGSAPANEQCASVKALIASEVSAAVYSCL